jgi:dTDP-4-amino-4,6-dideoxygalactose transaminase
MDVTDRQSERLIRLPLWVGLTPEQQDEVADILEQGLKLGRK